MVEFEKFVAIAKQDTQKLSVQPVLTQSSHAVVRYRQREKDMLINESPYLPAKQARVLVAATEVEPPALQLPNRIKTAYSNDCLTLVLLLSLVLVASVRTGYAKYISTLFHSVFNYSTAFRMFGEKNYSMLHAAFRLELLFYLLLSLFFYQLILFYSIPGSAAGLLLYGKTFAAIMAYFAIKKMVYRGLGSLFRGSEETSEFLFNTDNFNRAVGILILPVVALIAFSPPGNNHYFIFVGGIILVFFYAMLLKRGISILLKKQFSLFYLFLYLCTLEFLPLLVIHKIVVD